MKRYGFGGGPKHTVNLDRWRALVQSGNIRQRTRIQRQTDAWTIWVADRHTVQKNLEVVRIDGKI